MKSNILYIIFSTALVLGLVYVNKQPTENEEEVLCEEKGFTPSLEGHISLDFDTSIEHVEEVDAILQAFMTTDYEKAEEDYYWQWETDMTRFIDSICDQKQVFVSTDDTSRYDMVAEAIDNYTAMNAAGAQAEMNCYAEVLSILSQYKMMRETKVLAALMGEEDIRQEHGMFMQYTIGKMEWRARAYVAENGQLYSAWPMEENMAYSDIFETRMRHINEMLEVFDIGDLLIDNDTPSRKEKEEIKKLFHAMMPAVLIPAQEKGAPEQSYPTDTLGQMLLDWIDFRDKVAERQPYYIWYNYYGQTNEILADEVGCPEEEHP